MSAIKTEYKDTQLEPYTVTGGGDEDQSRRFGVFVNGRLAGRMEGSEYGLEFYVVPVVGRIFTAKNREEAITRLREAVL